MGKEGQWAGGGVLAVSLAPMSSLPEAGEGQPPSRGQPARVDAKEQCSTEGLEERTCRGDPPSLGCRGHSRSPEDSSRLLLEHCFLAATALGPGPPGGSGGGRDGGSDKALLPASVRVARPAGRRAGGLSPRARAPRARPILP